jgi:hypothetical protein
MVEVGVREARTTLSDLLRRVSEGEQVLTTRSAEELLARREEATGLPAPRRPVWSDV